MTGSPSLTLRLLALLLAAALLAVALWALAIGARATNCPLEASAFSCLALVRPSLRALGPIPIAPVLGLGAAVETVVALLLLARGARLPFARDAAILATLGAGFALGVQPLALLVASRACLVCLLALACQLALALTLGKLAVATGARARPIVAAFAVALVATSAAAVIQGAAQRRIDEDARKALGHAERASGRLVLVERPGCPYCEALLLDVLARPDVLPRVTKAGLHRRAAEPGEPAPLLLAIDAQGREKAREAGFTPDPTVYEKVLATAED